MKPKKIENVIPSLNYHLWTSCNMKCKFCFATFKDSLKIVPKGHLPKEKSLLLIKKLIASGFEKITFAGGEPTICPWLSELIMCAKESGATTMLVTNGSNLNDDFLEKNQKNLDWIVLSIDSTNIVTNRISGRMVINQTLDYNNLIDLIHKYQYNLKINTVVHSLNVEENFSEIINYANPRRWKVFQVLSIIGENDKQTEKLKITDIKFNSFLNRHQSFKENGIMISENNNEMIDSYAMVDPAGRFFTNKKGYLEYSNPILEVGVEKAYQQMNYNMEKFKERGGIYNWDIN